MSDEKNNKTASDAHSEDKRPVALALANATPRGLQLSTVEAMWQFSKIVASSGLAPKDYVGNPEACMVAIQFGAELGIGPMQSIQNISSINGRPALWGDAVLGKIQADPDFEWIKEQWVGEWNPDLDKTPDDFAAVCTIKRRGMEARTVAFSVQDARTAALWQKRGGSGQPTPWVTYPKRQLQMRARGFCARDTFADVLKGIKTAEELLDYPVIDGEAVGVSTDPADLANGTHKVAQKPAHGNGKSTAPATTDEATRPAASPVEPEATPDPATDLPNGEPEDLFSLLEKAETEEQCKDLRKRADTLPFKERKRFFELYREKVGGNGFGFPGGGQ